MVSKAQELYETFPQGNYVLVVVCGLEITGELEILTVSLQSRSQALDYMFSAVACVIESFSKKGNTGSFQALPSTLHLTPIASPRVLIPPQCFTGRSTAHKQLSYYTTEYYKVL